MELSTIIVNGGNPNWVNLKRTENPIFKPYINFKETIVNAVYNSQVIHELFSQRIRNEIFVVKYRLFISHDILVFYDFLLSQPLPIYSWRQWEVTVYEALTNINNGVYICSPIQCHDNPDIILMVYETSAIKGFLYIFYFLCIASNRGLCLNLHAKLLKYEGGYDTATAGVKQLETWILRVSILKV